MARIWYITFTKKNLSKVFKTKVRCVRKCDSMDTFYFQNYFYFSTEFQNLVNTLYLWISLGLAEASHWTVSVLIKFLLPELMSNVHSKLYKKLFTCICIYITFVHYGFGLHTYHISLKVQFFLACIHTVTYHSSKKIKYPKEVKKTSQGDANELKQGSRNLGHGGGHSVLNWS